MRKRPTGTNPGPHGAPHRSTLVCVHFTGVPGGSTTDIICSAELDIPAMKPQGTNVIDHAATDTSSIDKDAVGRMGAVGRGDLRREFNCIDTTIELPRGCTGIATPAESNDGFIGAVAGHVTAKGDGVGERSFGLAPHRGVDLERGDELHLALAREHAFDADTDEIGVIAVSIDPAIEEFFVGEGNRA